MIKIVSLDDSQTGFQTVTATDTSGLAILATVEAHTSNTNFEAGRFSHIIISKDAVELFHFQDGREVLRQQSVFPSDSDWSENFPNRPSVYLLNTLLQELMSEIILFNVTYDLGQLGGGDRPSYSSIRVEGAPWIH